MTSENTLSPSNGSDSDDVDHVIAPRGLDAPRVRSIRSENHIRVLALNNTFSNWRHSSSNCNGAENIEHQDLNKKNIIRGFQQQHQHVQTIEEVDETCENILPPPKLIQPKFKSKLPFSPRSYRKSYNHLNN